MRGAIITTRANEQGLWRAEIVFPHSLSESDERTEFNIGHQLPGLRRQARRAIVKEIAEREQKTGERLSDARIRVNIALGRLQVVDSDLDSQNRLHGITLGE